MEESKNNNIVVHHILSLNMQVEKSNSEVSALPCRPL